MKFVLWFPCEETSIGDLRAIKTYTYRYSNEDGVTFFDNFARTMEQTILLPSPNWFQVNVLVASSDSWLFYGGPSKSLCILEPLACDEGVVQSKQKYRAHVLNYAHPEKITNLDISPDWPERCEILTGSVDGLVRLWKLEKSENSVKIKLSYSHEVHSKEKEEVAGVGYCNETFAITVGTFGNIVKWDTHSNVVKTYNNILKNLKPNCMKCSPHVPFNIAIGTKQGLVIVLDLNGQGKILYKIRGQDDEILAVSWCPQYNVQVTKSIKKSEDVPTVPTRIVKKESTESSNASGVFTNLPDDSFEDCVEVSEDDMFDIYKDHPADEFGHKKYVPNDLVVEHKREHKVPEDFLAECLKLKEDILRNKNESESKIESLVEAMGRTHVDDVKASADKPVESDDTLCEENLSSEDIKIDEHTHLLATIGKRGGLRIWSKTGKLVGSCTIPMVQAKNVRIKLPSWTTVLWYRSKVVLVSDGKCHLLQCNPLEIDNNNKLSWSVVHAQHKRAVYCIASNAPRVQPPQVQEQECDEWRVWTVSQDRTVACAHVERRDVLAVHSTCGGFIYNVQFCPYDARKAAIAVGDGAVRVWEADTLAGDDGALASGSVATYWHKVSGKVLVVAWHPTRENLLAFATAESRVGLIDTGDGKPERAARALRPALRGGVYSLCWGAGGGARLYACAGGDLVAYDADRPDGDPVRIPVIVEEQEWEVNAAVWWGGLLVCGNARGAIAVLRPAALAPPSSARCDVLAVAFVFEKMIHTIEWHPEQTSDSNEKSKYEKIVAVCSLDKENTIALLEYKETEGETKLVPWKRLSGHTGAVLQLAWSPHREMLLLSTSHDGTVRVWDGAAGECVSIFGGHAAASLGAAWLPRPRLGAALLSGGHDACLRLWDHTQYPAHKYAPASKLSLKKEKKKKPKKNQEDKKAEVAAVQESGAQTTEQSGRQVAVAQESRARSSRKFLLPTVHKQLVAEKIDGPRRLFKMFMKKKLEENGGKETDDDKADESEEDAKSDVDYVKIFGSVSDLSEVLEMELAQHVAGGRVGAWAALMLVCGRVADLLHEAARRDLLCPFLLSLAPALSIKYWKDSMKLYLAQIDRFVATGDEEKLFQSQYSGGAVYRKVAVQLSVHDVRGAASALLDANLFKEAYVLCKVRHVSSIAEEVLRAWAKHSATEGTYATAAACYIALGELSEAAGILSRSNDQDFLSLAADIAKVNGQRSFADHVVQKKEKIENIKADNTEQGGSLKDLPSRMDLLMAMSKVQNGVPIEDNGVHVEE